MTYNPIRRLLSRGAAVALFVFVPLAASAAPITVPTDLNPGDKYRLAFVTFTSRDASSSNIADYNAFVTADAAGVPELAALGTTWTAIGSTPTVDARDNTSTNPNAATGVPVYRLDDTRIADDNADLWDGTLDAELNLTAYFDFLHEGAVWTGTTSPDGTSSVHRLSEEPVTFGRSNFTHSAWVSFSSAPLINTLRMYALSAELTVVPEPRTMSLLWIGVTAVVGWLLHRRRHRIRQ